MSDGTSQPKDTNLTYHCLILMSTNYTIWRMCMEVLLGIHGVWDVVDSGLTDAKKNDIVKGLLFQSIPEDLVFQIRNLKTEKEIWEAIKTRNLVADRVKEARLQTLLTKFENLKMSDNNIDAYVAKLSGVASKSAMLGEVMSEHKLVKKFLTSLPRRFVHSVAALEEVLDLKTTRFEDVTIPMGIVTKSEGEDVVPTLKVMVEVVVKDVMGATLKPSSDTLFQDVQIENETEENLSETHEGDVNHEEGTFFMMNHIQESIFMYEEKYTPPKSESNTDEDDVWKNGEQKLLKDIYYIPALRSNVISLGQVTI
ncbi:retrovirus-related pol polyprotein from transposon TNT 1-94 [Tanacetum coccineum]